MGGEPFARWPRGLDQYAPARWCQSLQGPFCFRSANDSPVMTAYGKDTEILRAIKAGTKAYLLKDARREELLDCIRRVNRGETCIPASLIEKVAIGLSSESLTGRELNVLVLLAQGKSNKEIGVSLYVSETTVKSHLRSIFRKLNVLSRTEAISVASRRGLIRL